MPETGGLVQHTIKEFLLAKAESTYGSDPSPASATDAILIEEPVSLTPVAGPVAERRPLQGFFGAGEGIHADQYVEIQFAAALITLGTASDEFPSALVEVMNACGYGGSGADLASEVTASVTIWCHYHNGLHKITGCRGNFALEYRNGAYPVIRFTLMGKYVAPIHAALPADADFTEFGSAALAVSPVNTPTCSLHSVGVYARSIDLDLGNAASYFGTAGGGQVVTVTDRRASGSMTFEAPLFATKDWFAAVQARTKAALQIVHGTVTHGIVTVDAPAVQLLNPRYSDDGGVNMLTLDLLLAPTAAGNDELVITVS